MNAKKRIKKERLAIPLMLQGYRRNIVNIWFDSTQDDCLIHGKELDPDLLAYWHKRGYLSSSIKRWNLTDQKEVDYTSDFDYLCMFPVNNSFGKWLMDMLTTQRVLYPEGSHFRKVYFSIIQRENKQLILRVGNEDRRYTLDDVLELIQEKGKVELRPTQWNNDSKSYLLSCDVDGESGETRFFCNNSSVSQKTIKKIIGRLDCSYVIADIVPTECDFGGKRLHHALDIWISNDLGEKPQILSAEMRILSDDTVSDGMPTTVSPVDLQEGAFAYEEDTLIIPEWNSLKEALCRDAAKIPQVSYFSASVAVGPDGDYTYLGFSSSPKLPQCRFNGGFNSYLKEKYETRFHKRTAGQQAEAVWEKIRAIEMETFSRKGMRQYMYGLWCRSAWDDLLHTKGVSLPQKLWAHKHGFFSWRLYQYGLTKENYREFLSDYDYYWLNRINNEFQIWVNDKTTFRYIMEPFKEFVPKYYFSVYKRDEEKVISKMWDCPADVPQGFDGMLEMLRREGILAFKASAGTHGDGFYCLTCEDGEIRANGEICGEEGLRQLVEETKSFYVVTEYLEMHKDLKKIYDKSVNTVRMMVVNDHGYDPRILQTYMRIGSSKTGYTDNVGYGGICVFVNKETGELYKPETIKDHVFYDCPTHPDTGVPIAGYLPHWELIRSTILDICRYLCELEYLGFDIAITDDGFEILEINIHQDLHKVASFDDDIKEFFKRKIKYKYKSTKKPPNTMLNNLPI